MSSFASVCRIAIQQARGPVEAAWRSMSTHHLRAIRQDDATACRGGSMHIADFSIAPWRQRHRRRRRAHCHRRGARNRYLQRGNVVCCFAATALMQRRRAGIVNFAAQAQFTNHLPTPQRRLPIVFLVCNNHYGMTIAAMTKSWAWTAWRAGLRFANNNMHSEVVNGMNVLAVRDAVKRATKLCREGKARCFWMWTATVTGPLLSDRATSIAQRRRSGLEGDRRDRDVQKELLEAKVLDAKSSLRLRSVSWTATPTPPSAPSRRRSARPGRADVHVHRHEVRDRAARVCEGESRRPLRRSSASTAN